MSRSVLTHGERVKVLASLLREKEPLSDDPGAQFTSLVRSLRKHQQQFNETVRGLKESTGARGVDPGDVTHEVEQMVTKVEEVGDSMGLQTREHFLTNLDELARAFEYPPMRNTLPLFADHELVDVLEILIKYGYVISRMEEEDSLENRSALNDARDALDRRVREVALRTSSDPEMLDIEIAEFITAKEKMLSMCVLMFSGDDNMARPLAKMIFGGLD